MLKIKDSYSFPKFLKTYIPQQLRCAINQCFRQKYSCFCMDEFADEEGNVAPITWYRSLGGHFMNEFYLSFEKIYARLSSKCIILLTKY